MTTDHPHQTPRLREFQAERSSLNDIVMKHAGRPMKRFFALDGETYRDGALPVRTKELLGLVASLVLRCDDCILYHVIRCHEEGVPADELQEAMQVGLMVGGSILIPHVRRAMRALDEMLAANE